MIKSFFKVGAIALLVGALGLGAPAPALAAGVAGYFAAMLLLEWFLAGRARSQGRGWIAMPRWQLLMFSFVALVVGVIGRAAWQFDWSSISRNRWIALIIAVIAQAATLAAWTRHSAHEGWTFVYMGGASFRDALRIAFLMPLIAPLAFLAAMLYFVAGDEVEAHRRQVDLQGSMCGAPSASPERIAPASWSAYACREQSAAGDLWDCSGDIAILSLAGLPQSRILELARLGSHALCRADADGAAGSIVADTFLRFKGLERPFIIVTELLRGSLSEYRTRMHIALTRATVAVAIICTPEALAADPTLQPFAGELSSF